MKLYPVDSILQVREFPRTAGTGPQQLNGPFSPRQTDLIGVNAGIHGGVIPGVEPAVSLAIWDVAPMTVTRFSPSHAAEDAMLVRDAQRGDDRAFGQLYERYARLVHGLLLARVPRSDVDDLVQEVFLSAWHRLSALREPAAFGGWLTMIARNRATDFHRRAQEAVELSPDLPGHDATAERAEALELLDIVRTLPEAYRDTLVLRLVEGLTGPEIADRTGLTPASVRVNLHRGFKMLREKLEP